MSFSYRIESNSDFAIISIIGRLIADETNELIEKIADLTGKGQQNIVFDLSALDYCNSSGLNFFVRSLTKSRNVGGDVTLCSLQPAVKKLFELSKLDQIFTVAENTTEATKRFIKA